MTPQRYQLVKRIFLDVCNSSESNRIAVLERECGSDDELRTEVESLLNQDGKSKSTGFLERPAINSAMFWNGDKPPAIGAHAHAGNGSSATARRPERIGQYRILDTLGEGGMGMVYLAEQDKPRRKVALKVIRPGIVSEPVMRRFEYEANLLGRLHHPGIAQIYEAGTADTGLGPQPFFAMELINGVSLRQYAKAMNLTVRQRLDLLARVCDAVHHAHQKGIIHRDLKPANILVEDEEGLEETRHQGIKTPDASIPRSLDASRGQPKILDFGVARATHTDPADTMRTNAGALIGTISYMSPEQIAADPHDLDTRADVYSMGVIFYEMLSDEHPHNLTGCTIAECARIIRDEDITPLSARDKSLRGDLETIVHKALEKDRALRYQSAAELAADTRRFLNDEPLQARPPSAVYQFRKFAKRNKIKLLGIAALLLAMLGGVGTILYKQQADIQEDAKLTVAGSYASLLAANITPRDGEDSIRPNEGFLKLAASTSKWVDDNQEDLPVMAAHLSDLLAQNYLRYGDYGQGLQFADQALGILQMHDPPPPSTAETAQSLHTRGRLLWHRGLFAEAEVEYRKALELRVNVLGYENRDTTMTMQHLAACLNALARFDEALSLLGDAQQYRAKFMDDSDPDMIAGNGTFAAIYAKQKRYDLAANVFVDAANKIREGFGPDDLRVARAMQNAARCWIMLGDSTRLETAEQYLQEALETQRRLMKGSENREVAATLREFGRLYRAKQDWQRAEESCRQALSIQENRLGVDHPETRQTRALLEEILQSAPATGTP